MKKCVWCNENIKSVGLKIYIGETYMCNCQNKVQEKMAEFVADKNPKYTNVEVELQGYLWVLEPHVSARSYMDARVTMDIPYASKPGTYKKIENQHAVFGYCPFCGEGY